MSSFRISRWAIAPVPLAKTGAIAHRLISRQILELDGPLAVGFMPRVLTIGTRTEGNYPPSELAGIELLVNPGLTAMALSVAPTVACGSGLNDGSSQATEGDTTPCGVLVQRLTCQEIDLSFPIFVLCR